MWIIFEGYDKTGKTTLGWEILKATNYKHVIIDRGPIGYMVYDKVSGRETHEGNQEFIKQARRAMRPNNNTIVVYCYADKYLINQRLEKHGEKLLNDTFPYKGKSYSYLQKLYLSNILRYYDKNRVVLIDTEKNNIEECIHLIKEKIKEFS